VDPHVGVGLGAETLGDRRRSFAPPANVGMKMVEGPWFFELFAGGWRFAPVDGGARTRATWRYNFRRWPGAVAWALWALAILGVATVPWFDHLLRQAGRSDLTQLDLSTLPLVLAALVAATVGAVLAARRPRHPVGWLLLALGLSVTGSGLADGYARYGLIAEPGALPAAHWVAVYSPATVQLGFTCVGFVLLLTPGGTLPSPRWRWWARLMAASPIVFLIALTAGPGFVLAPYDTVIGPPAVPALAATALAFAVTAGGMVVGAWSLVVRFRRAGGVERQQLRWVALAAAVTLPLAAIILAGVALGATSVAVFLLAVGLCLALLPLATGAAILRYRLYDLDRIISRTLAYGLVTVLLGGVYAGLVLSVGRLAPQGSSLTIAAATLAVAAAFQPLRRRVQDRVDRRFNRRRYDAARTITAFSAHLRQEVDLGTLTEELLGVVDQTMQPSHAALWLRPADRAP
jgi:hypothetical protein